MLEKTILKGINPNDITLQVIAWKKMTGETSRFRVMLWDGHCLYKNALLVNSSLPPPEKWSVIRLGSDIQPEDVPELQIREMQKDQGVAYAFMFSYYVLKHDGSEVNHRLEKPGQATVNMAAPSTPSNQPSAQLNNATPPNVSTPSAPPEVRQRSSGGASQSLTGTPERRAPNREAVKRNLAASFPPPAAKRQNTGQVTSTQSTRGQATNGEGGHQMRNNGGTMNVLTAVTNSASHPIAALNPYSNRYTIKVRVSQKSDLMEKSNSRGWQGKIINTTLSDESGDIMLKGFNEFAEAINDSLQHGKTYLLTMAAVKPVHDKRYNSTGHDYELNWNQFTKVTGPLLADPVKVNYNFVPINQIRDVPMDKSIDVAGWVQEAGNLVEFTSRAGRDLKKREVILADDSQGGSSITLTLWEKMAVEFNHNGRVIAIKGAKVGEWNQVKNLSLGFSGDYEVEPDNARVEDLIAWSNTLKADQLSQAPTQLINTSFGPVEELTTIQELKDELIAHRGEKKCKLFGQITMIQQENIFYRAHTPPDGTRCNKKVTGSEGSYECGKCGRRNIQDCDTTLRFNVRMSIADCTSTSWCNMFDAGSLFKKDVDEMNHLLTYEMDQYERVLFSKSLVPMIFRVSAKIQTFNDAPKLQITVNEASEIDWSGGATPGATPWQELVRPLIAEVHALEAEMGVAHDQEVGVTWAESIDI